MWYFARNDKRLRYDDNREIKVGITHEVTFPYTYEGETFEKPTLCKAGLHASKNILDALKYAGGAIIYKVKLEGDIVHGDDKSVARKRTYISGGIDISDILLKFARMCALDVIHLWDAPDVVVRYLKTGDESIREDATDADAAHVDAAYAAAYATDADAAYAAAYAAAAAAAAYASAVVIRKKQNARLTRMVNKRLREIKGGE